MEMKSGSTIDLSRNFSSTRLQSRDLFHQSDYLSLLPPLYIDIQDPSSMISEPMMCVLHFNNCILIMA